MIATIAMIAGAAPSIAQMRDHRRVLVVAAPSQDDPLLKAQRRSLAGWGKGVADRNISVVEVVGDRVSGATDSGATLRQRYHLPPGAFAVVLIGKDGHEAYRSAQPVLAEQLQGRIDAMPMRRAGQR